MAGATAAFGGFPPEALDFYVALEANNTRTWWLDNKDVYDTSVKEPMLALTAALAHYGEFKIFRPNRDVRFSKDKSPYKTHIGAVTEGEGGEFLYMQFSSEGLFVGTGYYRMAKDQLERFRAAIDDDEAGEQLEAIVETIDKKKGYEIGGEALKTAPRGYARDHERVRLLRHKGLTLGRSFEPAKWLHTSAARKRITDTWHEADDLNRWLATHVGPSEQPPEDLF